MAALSLLIRLFVKFGVIGAAPSNYIKPCIKNSRWLLSQTRGERYGLISQNGQAIGHVSF